MNPKPDYKKALELAVKELPRPRCIYCSIPEKPCHKDGCDKFIIAYFLEQAAKRRKG
jgi:hypothetical protein